MPQLGLHSDQGAAEKRTSLRLLQKCGALRTGIRGRSASGPRKDRGTLARSSRNHVERGAVPAEQERHRPHPRIRTPHGPGTPRRGRHGVRGRPHRSRHGSAPPRNGVHARRWRARDLVAAGADARPPARVDDRRGLGSHRQRIRVVLRRAGREGDDHRIHAPHDAPRRRRGVEDHGARVPQTARDGADLDHGESRESQRRRAL